jgi:zinc D-Ala-D-Ala carboxypeptidase
LRKARPAASSAAKSADDIPIAQRDRHTPPTAKSVAAKTRLRQRQLFLLMGMMMAIASLVAVTLLLLKNNSNNTSAVPSSPAATNNNPISADTLLHHFRYAEAPASQLASIGGGLRLRRPAAQKFQLMLGAAQAAGVNINTISAFRSVSEQQRLFFDVKAERAQAASKRAEVSAPPNYSEHHTGYAVDLGDNATPAANLNESFDQTAAFKWLAANAARYSFELSFRQNNTQGVSYEPWHWRYVGDSDSLETFYKAKQSQP